MRIGIPMALLNFSEGGMICEVCKKYDQIGTFITGCCTYKRHSIICHDKLDGHIINMKKDNAKPNPDSAPAANLREYKVIIG